jgi:hypothetical protein
MRGVSKDGNPSTAFDALRGPWLPNDADRRDPGIDTSIDHGGPEESARAQYDDRHFPLPFHSG